MKKILPLIFIGIISTGLSANAQYTRYIIKLKDKGFSFFTLANPVQYLSQQAVDRRTKYNIAIDSTDLPVTPRYLDSIRLSGNVVILNTSKWLNQVAISTTDANALAKINSFSFVQSAAPIAARTRQGFKHKDMPGTINFVNYFFNTENKFAAAPLSPAAADYYNYGKSNGQVKIHQGEFLHNHGFRGEGMQLTILDAGFYHYLSLPTFDSIRSNNQVLGTWDFVANEASVDEDYEHGMECLSTIAANIPGIFVGTAPKASFYLYRTEDVYSEYPIEEQNWAAGIERADSLGVPVSSTSLGYNTFDDPTFNYSYADMDGNTTISARAADFAAKKGMLLIIAAGNTGNDSWQKIITPADADSVVAVGAVDTLGTVASFSAYGPSSDGQVKPAVAAVGLRAYVASPSNGLPVAGNGTSFACPNMAGLATCLWQAFPEVNNMSIIDAMEKSASKAAAPDTRTGFGIPDMKKAFVLLQKKLFTQNASLNNCVAALSYSVKTGQGMVLEVQRKAISEPGFSTVHSFTSNNEFAVNNLIYNDDLSAAQTGTILYRLKMTIDTDTAFYFDTATVSYTQSCMQAPVQNNVTIGPNPLLTNNLIVTIARATAAKIDIVIANAAGQRVYEKIYQQAAGAQTELISTTVMSKGVYFVTVFIDGKKAATKQILK